MCMKTTCICSSIMVRLITLTKNVILKQANRKEEEEKKKKNLYDHTSFMHINLLILRDAPTSG